VVDELMSGARADFFRSLTMTWMRVAYAHLLPDRSHFEALCQRWPQHFGGVS